MKFKLFRPSIVKIQPTLESEGVDYGSFLERHCAGDWGHVELHREKRQNALAKKANFGGEVMFSIFDAGNDQFVILESKYDSIGRLITEIAFARVAEKSAKFDLGKLFYTPGARALIPDFSEFLARHITGDWGDIPEEDKRLNDLAAAQDPLNERIVSAYFVRGQKVLIITEPAEEENRTTVLLAEEY